MIIKMQNDIAVVQYEGKEYSRTYQKGSVLSGAIWKTRKPGGERVTLVKDEHLDITLEIAFLHASIDRFVRAHNKLVEPSDAIISAEYGDGGCMSFISGHDDHENRSDQS